jgi:integrase/recombinase XerC
MSDLALYTGSQHAHARQLAGLQPEELKRRAVLACRENDGAALWSIVLGYLTLYGVNTLLTSPHTVRSYRTGVLQFVEYAGENSWQWLGPRRSDGQLYINSLLAAGRSIQTVRSRLAAVRLLYRALRWCEATNSDPFEDTKVPVENTNPWDRSEPYTEEELERLLAAADPTERALILLLAHGGLRISEALDLLWQDLDLERSRLRVNRGKGRKQRVVSISRSLAVALGELPRGAAEQRLFPFRGRSGAVKRLHRAVLESGIRFRGFHAFRKYSGTRLMAQVKDIARVAKHLGHADVNTTRTYAQLGVDDLQKELGEW